MLTILPGLVIFAIGYLLKRSNILTAESGTVLLKIVFYVGGPALAFHSIVTAEFSKQILVFPLSALILYGCSYLAARYISPWLHLPRPSQGTFILSCMIINVGFTIPFIILAFGDYGVARILLFDVVGDICLFGWAYIVACQYNTESKTNYKVIVRKLMYSPPMWAILLAILTVTLQFPIPQGVTALTTMLGQTVGPLMLLSLGLFFEPKIIQTKPTTIAIAIRMLGGLLIGYVVASLFNLQGAEKQILLLAAASPVGFTTITFSSLEKLDTELAASTVSISVLIGMILIPIILWLS